MRLLIHYIVDPESKSIESTCGRWDTGVNWTKMRNAVTCPHCLARLDGCREDPLPANRVPRPAA